MKTPPQMLSPKDTLYISDILRIILVMHKKLDEEKQTIQDNDVRMMFDEASTLLSQQYASILNFLK